MIGERRFSRRLWGHGEIVGTWGHGAPFAGGPWLLLVLALPLAGCLNASRSGLASAGGTEPTAGLATSSGAAAQSGAASPAARAALSMTVQAGEAGMPISRDLWGIFFEDINWGADGGLYAELVENRSFEFTNTYNAGYDFKTGWTLVERGGGRATFAVESLSPLSPANRHYGALTIERSGGGVGLRNEGFAGIPVGPRDTLRFSFWARRTESFDSPFTVALENVAGTRSYGSATVGPITSHWERYTATIATTNSEADTDARLVVLSTGTGTVHMDMISLFPARTFKDRPNGMREDVARFIAELKPKVMRFPGGCVVHSNRLATSYRWKSTIGPVEQRSENENRWNYHMTNGAGFYELFQFAEDIGAKPFPVLPAGCSCHFEGSYSEVRMGELDPWIQDALDLIEYCNGSPATAWGAKRAAAGHPAPFNLEYLGIGNEEWGQGFKERFTAFFRAIKASHPEIKVVGTAGPFANDFDNLWAFNRQLGVDIVDEHYYKRSEWFYENTARYDDYGRNGPKVFVGEFASNSNTSKNNDLASALAEAAYMTGMERNGDLILNASYAPLLCNVNATVAPRQGSPNWNPDLIYFDHFRIYGTPSYYVQRLFSANQGDTRLPVTDFSYKPGKAAVSRGAAAAPGLFTAASRESASGDIILKLVNPQPSAADCLIAFAGVGVLKPTAAVTVLAGKPSGANSFEAPLAVTPKSGETPAANPFRYTAPAHSLSVIRVSAAR